MQYALRALDDQKLAWLVGTRAARPALRAFLLLKSLLYPRRGFQSGSCAAGTEAHGRSSLLAGWYLKTLLLPRRGMQQASLWQSAAYTVAVRGQCDCSDSHDA